MVDIDHFKNVNDTYGHQSGDEVLKSVTRVLVDLTRRDNEHVIRYGGEEFIVLLTHTSPRELRFVADHIREKIEANIIALRGGEMSVTVSIGGAYAVDTQAIEIDDLIGLADRKLYEAKDAGRNRVFVSAEAVVVPNVTHFKTG